MSELSEKQTLEYFTGGLKKAASAARKLGHLKGKRKWVMIADSLDLMLTQGLKLVTMKPLSEIEVLKTVNERQKQMNIQ